MLLASFLEIVFPAFLYCLETSHKKYHRRLDQEVPNKRHCPFSSGTIDCGNSEHRLHWLEAIPR